MKVCFVSRGTPDSFSGVADGDVDLTVFAFQGGVPVSYEKELRGETAAFSKIAEISRRYGVTVCGLQTDARGIKRKSVLVAENGRILGVSDMVNVIDGAWNVGANTRVFQTKKCRIGIVVAEDLYFPETVKTLSVCGSDFIVCPYPSVIGTVESALIRSHAFCFGVPIFLCARGYHAAASVDGAIAFAGAESPAEFTFSPMKEYHLVETRLRGFYRAPKKDF